MKLRNIVLGGVLGGLGVIASSMAAQALDFNFSMIGNQGSNPGSITGIIRGLSDNSVSGYTEIEVLTSPNEDYKGIYGIWAWDKTGSFVVNNGIITSVNNVAASKDFGSKRIQFNWNNTYNGTFDSSGNIITFNDGGFGGVTYSSATAVPFDFNPTEGAALGIPLFIGLGMLRKKKLAQKSAAKKVAELVS